MNAECPHEAVHCHEQALGLFEAAGDRPGIAQTLDLLGMAASIAGDGVRADASPIRSPSSRNSGMARS